MTRYIVTLKTTSRKRNGQNPRPHTTVMSVDANNVEEAQSYVLASFSINFPFSGENIVSYDDIQVNPPV